MILHLSYEEIVALRAGADRVLTAAGAGAGVVAPPAIVADLESFNAELRGDVAVGSLAEHARLRRVLVLLRDDLNEQLAETILMSHPAAEEAVAAYFDFAHVLTTLNRLDIIGVEMRALVEVLTGDAPDSDAGRRFSFPD